MASRFSKFLALVEGLYEDKNPYHNAYHAADVTNWQNYERKAKAYDTIQKEKARRTTSKPDSRYNPANGSGTNPKRQNAELKSAFLKE